MRGTKATGPLFDRVQARVQIEPQHHRRSMTTLVCSKKQRVAQRLPLPN